MVRRRSGQLPAAPARLDLPELARQLGVGEHVADPAREVAVLGVVGQHVVGRGRDHAAKRVQAVRRRAHPPVRAAKAELPAGRHARVHVLRQMPDVDGLPRRRHEGHRAGLALAIALDEQELPAGQARESLRDARPFAHHRRQRRAEKRQLLASGGARQDEDIDGLDDALAATSSGGTSRSRSRDPRGPARRRRPRRRAGNSAPRR